MVEIVKQLGWTYVSTVAAQGEYGEKVRVLFQLPELSALFTLHPQHSSDQLIIDWGGIVTPAYVQFSNEYFTIQNLIIYTDAEAKCD